MPFRFWRRIRIAPGVTLNLSKSTASLSFGPRGAKYTLSPRGNRVTAGLPGTGLFYTVHEPRRPSAANAPRVAQRDRLNLGFFQRLFTPADERTLVEGLKALNVGDEGAALAAFEKAASLPDAAWMAGMLRLRREEFAPAKRHLEAAMGGLDRLGGLFEKYKIAAQVTFPVTPEVDAHARPCERGTRLALVEIAQFEGDRAAAMRHLERLLVIEPGDPVVLLSLAELTLEGDAERVQLERVIALTTSTSNETPVDTALLLYRGRAMAGLGLPDAAIDVFTLALRRRKDRSEGLLRQLRYERAVLYNQVGRKAQARREFERVYAEDPGFEDVRRRLGLGDG
jgi:tetratricopeptide (TPR) repeat protein